MLTLILTTLLLATATASARFSLHRFPHWWYLQAVCIHRHESTDWFYGPGHTSGRIWNGYYGGMQFLLSTWQRAGGQGYPHQAIPNEQYYRAWIIWRQSGGSWRQWGTAGMCGLR